MLRQALAASSRGARSSLRAAEQIPLFRSQFRAAPLVSFRPAQPSFSRWYSVETQSAQEAKEAADAKPASESETPDADGALKKDLEAKAKELLEWKVRIHLVHCP